MIVDLHSWVWQAADQLGPRIAAHLRARSEPSARHLDAGPGAHEAAMQAVDHAFVIGFRSRYLKAEVPNAFVAATVARQPGMLTGIAGLDPMAAASLKSLDEVRPMGLSGVAVSPAAQDFHPTHSRAMPFYEKCQHLRLPLIVHQGPCPVPEVKMQFARPWLLDEIARSFPLLKIVVAQCGHPWADETLALVAKHPNVYAIISHAADRTWRLYTTLLEAHQLDVIDKLFFGSEFPFNQPQKAVETMLSLNRFAHSADLPVVPRERLRSIVERDPFEALGIERRGGAPAGPDDSEPDDRANDDEEETTAAEADTTDEDATDADDRAASEQIAKDPNR